MTTASDLVEELQRKYNLSLIDYFKSTEMLNEVVTQTGVITKELFQVKLETGVQANSTVKLYYNLNKFNPKYSSAYFRVSFDSIQDIFAYVGFKKAFSDPAFDDVASHSALIIHDNEPKLSTGNELGVTLGYQNTLVSGLDLTRDFIIKIEDNKLFSMPLPQVIPYFDTFRIVSPDRVWSLKVANGNFPPEDLTHYIMFYIKNNTNTNKVMTIKHFMYLEEYAD